jgi:hypothetical protein
VGCYVEDYRAREGVWAGRFSWREVPIRGDANGTAGDCLGWTVLISMLLGLLLMIVDFEQNSGLVVEVQNTALLLSTGWVWNVMSGIQCELCEFWNHYSGGSVKSQASEGKNSNYNTF